MIVASGIELRAGARLLLADASFQVAEGDRIGLVGRNGAGKTTLAKVLSGAALPAAGTVRHSGTVGYLPQDPRTGDLDILALDRILSARGLDEVREQMRKAEALMSDPDPAKAEKAIRRYGTPVGPPRGARRVRGRVRGGVHGRLPRPARPGAAASRCTRCPAASAAGSS